MRCGLGFLDCESTGLVARLRSNSGSLIDVSCEFCGFVFIYNFIVYFIIVVFDSWVDRRREWFRSAGRLRDGGTIEVEMVSRSDF